MQFKPSPYPNPSPRLGMTIHMHPGNAVNTTVNTHTHPSLRTKSPPDPNLLPRIANPTAPIIAVAAPHFLRDAIVSAGDGLCTGDSADSSRNASTTGNRAGRVHGELARHFSECLTTPVSSTDVRALVGRWLLVQPHQHTLNVGMPVGTARTGVVDLNRARSKSGLTIRLPPPASMPVIPEAQRGAPVASASHDFIPGMPSYSSMEGWSGVSALSR